MWQHTGQQRPPFAIEPAPGQESVWDYPRPPVVVDDPRSVEVYHGGTLLARSNTARRVLETASPPTWYLPPDAVDWTRLLPHDGASFCEWKGRARYWALPEAPGQAVAWAYPNPSARFAAITGWVAFYPARLRCMVDGEAVRAQVGGFYGGWITDDVVGPFKGDPGTGHW
jgi:uncharacterized protein (DUF427 family)